MSFSAPRPAAPSNAVSTEEEQETQNKKDNRRVGRAALISTPPRGVLGSPFTGRRQLTDL